jgi:hypothetical protein
VIVILGTTLCGRGGPVDKQGRGVPFVWVTPGALRELFIASAGSRAHAGIVFAGVLVDEALRMRCHTACSSQGRARNAQWLPAVALLAPRTATEPVSLTPTAPIHGLSTFQTLAPSLAAIPGTSFAVSPSPKHASTPVTSTTPAALAVARSQQTGCRHGTKERVLEAQGWQSFSHPWPSSVVSAHWRWVIVRRGSAAAAVCCTQYISSLPMPLHLL